MSRIIIFCFFLGLSGGLIAQESESYAGPKWEIGFNTTNLLEQIFGDTEINADQSPFVITANRIINEGFNYRFGLGYRFRSEKISNDQNNLPILNVKRDMDIDLRFGVEFRKKIGGKFGIHYGVDMITGVADLVTEQGDFVQTTSTNTTYSIGLGPVFGFRYQFTEKACLWVESSLYSIYNSNSNVIEFDQGSGIPEIRESVKGVNSRLTTPTSLFLSFKF